MLIVASLSLHVVEPQTQSADPTRIAPAGDGHGSASSPQEMLNIKLQLAPIKLNLDGGTLRRLGIYFDDADTAEADAGFICARPDDALFQVSTMQASSANIAWNVSLEWMRLTRDACCVLYETGGGDRWRRDAG